MLAEVSLVLLDIGRVDDDANVLGAELVDDTVVDDSAVGIADGGVQRLAVHELVAVIGDQHLDGVSCLRTAKVDLAHV